jgi:exopolysaccharide biosynthesis polyprenyl glycosylphosphotransferase
MSKATERLLLFLSDLITINLAWLVYYYIRVETGWIIYANPPAFLAPLIAIYVFWLTIFSFAGLYQYWFARSRFDEFTLVFKAVSFGCFFLFFAIFIDDFLNKAPAISRFLIVIYWALMFIFVGAGRIVIRSIQKNLLGKGIGLRNTLIVGTGRKAYELKAMIDRTPELGYKVLGFISETDEKRSETDLGSIDKIPILIKDRDINEILIALEPDEKERLFEILRYSTDERVSMKILPDMYEIVSGMAKTSQIYGVPLIEVAAAIMPPYAMLFKRLIDIVIAVVSLTVMFPLILFAVIVIKLSSKGPVMYKQVRVGRKGKEFVMYKLRTMHEEAESEGPQWSGGDDPRVTGIGRFLRRSRLDELPQMINVLKNEMSVVGPRPERPFFVELLKREIPYYYKRMLIKPGITGWAQVKHKYDSSFEDVRSKLQYDFFYIENMSLKLDFKIMVNTIFVMLRMKGI